MTLNSGKGLEEETHNEGTQDRQGTLFVIASIQFWCLTKLTNLVMSFLISEKVILLQFSFCNSH